MTTPLKDQPAFPVWDSTQNGLSKLELFAAMAMQGICANADLSAVTNEHSKHHLLAENAVEVAKALLAELEKENP